MFIDSMQLMNSSLDIIVKKLSDKDFKYLIEEFGSEYLKLLKQKGAYSYEYMNSFEKFNEEKLPARKYFYSSIKDWKIGNDGKISHGHISVKDYLTCEKTCDKYGRLSRSLFKKRRIIISWCFWKVYWNMFEILWTRSLSLF